MDYDALVEAVKEHSEMDDDAIKEAGQYGASAGWPGFTYYTDTVAFYDENANLIDKLLQESADSMGYTVLELMASFGGAEHVHDEDTRKNLLAWFALEEAGRYLESKTEEEGR
jgi:hypothetical protein